jgi:hypothetical protein
MNIYVVDVLNHHVSWEINGWTSKDGAVPFLKSPIVTEVVGPAISHTLGTSSQMF